MIRTDLIMCDDDNISISENLSECRRQHGDFCETLNEIEQVFLAMRDITEQAQWWEGDAKAQFVTVMNQRFEEFEQLKVLAKKEEAFFECWKNHVTIIHALYDDFITNIGGL